MVLNKRKGDNMKTLVCLVVSMLVAVNCFGASKPTNWVELTEIHAGIMINENVGDEENPEFYPIIPYFDGMAMSEDGGNRAVRASVNMGTPQAEPFDLETLAGQKAFYQAVPAILRPLLKELRQQATDENLEE